MKIIKTELPGVVILEPDVFSDSRGYFMEGWQQARYSEAGLPGKFVQDNISFSKQGVLRGLHFQNPHPQGKLVSVLQGEVYDVAVDIRVGSPAFRQWVGITLSAENKRQLYLPKGIAHGFCVKSAAGALFMYKCTDYYNPAKEIGLLWNDPEIGITWPVADPILSAKDSANLRLCDIPLEKLPRFGG